RPRGGALSAVDRLLKSRLIGIVRLHDLDLAVASAACAIEAGLEVIEVTFTVPNAARAIERLRHEHPTALIGAGTVRTLTELEKAATAGAEFLVAPGLNPELVEAEIGRAPVRTPVTARSRMPPSARKIKGQPGSSRLTRG